MGTFSKTYTWLEGQNFQASEFNENLFDFYGTNSLGSAMMYRGLDSANFSNVSNISWPASQILIRDTQLYWTASDIVTANITADTVSSVEKYVEAIAAKNFSITATGSFAWGSGFLNANASTVQGIVRDLTSQISSIYLETQDIYPKTPHLLFISGSTLEIQRNVSSSDQSELLFPDNTLRVASGASAGIRFFQYSASGVFRFGSACMVGGLLSGENTNNQSSWLCLYAVGVCNAAGTRTNHFVPMGTTQQPIDATAVNLGFNQLNSQFGSANWVYLGTVKRDNNSIQDFVQQRQEFFMKEIVTLISGSQGTSAFTYTASFGMSAGMIPSHFSFIRTEIQQVMLSSVAGTPGRSLIATDHPNTTTLFAWNFGNSVAYNGDPYNGLISADQLGLISPTVDHLSNSNIFCRLGLVCEACMFTSNTALSRFSQACWTFGTWFFKSSNWDTANYPSFESFMYRDIITDDLHIRRRDNGFLSVQNAIAFSTLYPTSNINSGWHNLILAHDLNGSDVLYLNNSFVASTPTITHSLSGSGARFAIGSVNSAITFTLKGALRDYFVHVGVAYNSAQVNTIYSAAIGLASQAGLYGTQHMIDNNPVYAQRVAGRDLRAQHFWVNRDSTPYRIASTVSACNIEINLRGWIDGKL